MGLDLSHGNFGMPYSYFNEWRRALAAQVGIDLTDMEGHGGPVSWATYRDSEDLCVLLNHSDCDGQIEVADLPRLIARLKVVAADMLDAYDRERAAEFIASCEEALAANEPLEFF